MRKILFILIIILSLSTISASSNVVAMMSFHADSVDTGQYDGGGRDVVSEIAPLIDKADQSSKSGDYNEAIRYGTEALRVIERSIGRENMYYAIILVTVADYYSEIDDIQEPIRLATEALDIMDRTIGKMNDDYISALSDLSRYTAYAERYDEAISLAAEAMELTETVFGKDSRIYAVCLGNMATFNSYAGNYREAIKFVTQALEVYERINGKDNRDYAGPLANLSNYYARIGEYTESIRCGNEALEIVARVIGKDNYMYATINNNLSNAYTASGDYNNAIRVLKEASEIYSQLGGANSRGYADLLDNLSQLNYRLGDYDEAIRLITEALSIYEQVIGKEHSDYALSLMSLSLYYSAIGDDISAIAVGDEALNVLQHTVGTEHKYYADMLCNTAGYYAHLGNYPEAISLITEALDIYEKVIGKDSVDYATTLSLLANYNSRISNITDAIQMGTESLSIIEKTLGRNHTLYAGILNNIATYYMLAGDYRQAIRFGSDALSVQKDVLGTGHPEYSDYLDNIAVHHFFNGDYDKAISMGLEAYELRKQILGNTHPKSILSLTNMSDIYYGSNNPEELITFATEANRLKSERVRTTFAGLTAYERNKFWDREKEWFEGSVNKYAYRYPANELITIGLDASLIAKGILLNSEREFSQLILESGDEAALDCFTRLQASRRMLDKLYEQPVSERAMDTDSLELVVRNLERQLVTQSKVYGDFTRNISIGWRDVVDKLGDRDVAIEFVSFPVDNDSIIYAAYVMRRNMKKPQMVTLFEDGQLNAIPPTQYYSTRNLSNLVWNKLDDHIKDADNIYFAPTGQLYNIAIESLPHYDGDDLMSERHNLYRLSSTRELVVAKDRKDLNKAALYGGLKYDADLRDVSNMSSVKSDITRYESAPLNIVDAINIRGGVSELPATKIEVDNIGKSFEHTGIRPLIFTDADGTEESFKALSGNHINIIHIATHGFYWTEREARRVNNLSFLLPFDNTTRYTEDRPLTRSGLLFAGANNTLSGESESNDSQDGILTAKEISVLDFRGLDMVVLSACQTGLGEITGDGVFGLQRGFKKAGANTILMSLWKVDDRATQMLMSKFYEAFLSGRSKHESLLDAQRYLREYEEYDEVNDMLTRPFNAPYYWASFILLDAID